MDAKEYLSQCIHSRELLDAKREQLRFLTDIATSATQTLTGMPSGGRTTSKVENAVAKIVDLQTEILDDMTHITETSNAIYRTIQKVDDCTLRAILEYRYMTGMEWRNISDRIGYEERYTQKLHGAALRIVQQIIDGNSI